jgi:rubrerythrin
VLDATQFHAKSDEARRRVDELISRSEEHSDMVRQLEHTVDTVEGNPLNLGEVPTGDEIAAELERYLRGD